MLGATVRAKKKKDVTSTKSTELHAASVDGKLTEQALDELGLPLDVTPNATPAVPPVLAKVLAEEEGEGLAPPDAEPPPDPPPPGSTLPSAAHGTVEPLPPPPSPKLTPVKFFAYGRSLGAKHRARVCYYVYRLFPVINLKHKDPGARTYIDVLPGEQALTDVDDVLGRWGCGDYWITLNDSGRNNKKVCETVVRGWTENLPHFRDLFRYPPVISDIACVTLDDPKNIQSGYVSYLKQRGLVGDSVMSAEQQQAQQLKEKEQNEMAAENASAMGAMAGALASVATSVMNRDTATATPSDSERIWENVDKMTDKMGELYNKAAVDPVSLISKTVAAVKELIPTPPPQDNTVLNQVLAQNAELATRVDEMRSEQLKDLRAELREMRQEVVAARSGVIPGAGAPKTVLEQLREVKDFVAAVKDVAGVGGDDDDRRVLPEPTPAPAPRKGLMDIIVENLPQIMQVGLGLLQQVTAMRSGQPMPAQPAPVPYAFPAYPTGPGLPMVPVPPLGTMPPIPAPPPPMTSAPVAVPAFGGGMPSGPADGPGIDPRVAAQYGGGGGGMEGGTVPSPNTVSMPAIQNPPQAQPATQPPPPPPPMSQEMQQLIQLQTLLHDIEIPLVNHLEKSRRGYEFAEWFIMSRGRLGLGGYDALRANSEEAAKQQAGFVVKLLEPGAMPQLPQGLYPPLWVKIAGNKAGFELFLTEFMTLDLFLAENGVQDWLSYCLQQEDIADAAAEEDNVPDTRVRTTATVTKAKKAEA